MKNHSLKMMIAIVLLYAIILTIACDQKQVTLNGNTENSAGTPAANDNAGTSGTEEVTACNEAAIMIKLSAYGPISDHMENGNLEVSLNKPKHVLTVKGTFISKDMNTEFLARLDEFLSEECVKNVQLVGLGKGDISPSEFGWFLRSPCDAYMCYGECSETKCEKIIPEDKKDGAPKTDEN